jgi:hypothetical protein
LQKEVKEMAQEVQDNEVQEGGGEGGQGAGGEQVQEMQEEVEVDVEADESVEERVGFALYALARLTGQAVPGDKEGEMNASRRGNS